MATLSLTGKWQLRGEFLDVTPERIQEVLSREPGEYRVIKRGDHIYPYKKGWMSMQVPGDVITPLVAHGILHEPFDKMHSKDCTWTKDLSWWFVKSFDISEDLLEHEEIRLYIEMLDHKAHIFINGIPVGEHKNTFRPFTRDIKAYLKYGPNQIVIRLTCGIEDYYSKDSISHYCVRENSLADQRIYLRKPQFTFGWDWCQPLPTCGIGGDIYLEGITGAKITNFRMDTLEISKSSSCLEAYFEIDNLRLYSADDAKLTYTIRSEGAIVYKATKELYLTGGLSFYKEIIKIENPKIWWPNGSGEQPLYEVEASISCRGITNKMLPKKIGIRTITLNQERYEDGTRAFEFRVNGEKIFCKGGNWVPTDSYYLRTPLSTYETLVDEAKAAHFNMLRMWGGGTYEPDYFYEKCSENGILIMHDFMYACAFYPDQLDWFVSEARLEAEYQTKRLAHYPCLAMWTGNNEIHESYTDWFPEMKGENFPGAKIFNYIQPEVVKNNCPRVPYMPSSPFGGERANADEAGDAHVWKQLGNGPGKFKFLYELEAFDRLEARFSSEYGFFGALKKSSIERYHGDDQVVYGGETWVHHGEFERKRRHIDSVIDRHLTEFKNLGMDDYLLYSGVMQGCLYQEMAESLRHKPYCSGDLIWMYNDCWPETGWTIIDYYLTRKNAFYFLKRAFAEQKLIIRVQEGICTITGHNDTNGESAFELEYGYMDFRGQVSDVKCLPINMPKHSYNVLVTYDVSGYDLATGFIFARPKEHYPIETATSIRAYYRDYKFVEAEGIILKMKEAGDNLIISIQADAYVPIAYLEVSDDRVKWSDNYFPLIPGENKEITLYGCQEKPVLKFLEIIPK